MNDARRVFEVELAALKHYGETQGPRKRHTPHAYHHPFARTMRNTVNRTGMQTRFTPSNRSGLTGMDADHSPNGRPCGVLKVASNAASRNSHSPLINTNSRVATGCASAGQSFIGEADAATGGLPFESGPRRIAA